MATRIFRLLVLLLMVAISPVNAQLTHSFPDVQFISKNWNNTNGLIQNSVADIIEDENGYLWLATEEGVVRFDGTNFEVVNQDNTPGLHSSTFYDLFKSKQGVWAAALNTVLYLNNSKIKSFDFRSHLKSSWISAISEDSNGMLWIGTNHGELFFIKNQKIVKYSGWPPARESTNIQILRRGPMGLLVGTERGLFQIDKNQVTVSVPGFKTQNIRALEIHKDGSLWIGTKDDGLYQLKGEKIIQYTEKHGLNELFIRSLGISPRGDIWIGTSSSGIQIFRDGKFENLKDNGIANDGIKSIFFSDPDLIWLGTPASGLIQMKPARIQKILKSDGLADKVILPIFQHRNGEIWIGTAGQGINRIKNGKIINYTRRDGLASEIVISIYSANEKILVGTAGGLNIFNLKTAKFEKEYTIKDGLASNIVQSVLEDSKGRIWISTALGGVHLLENDKIKRFSLPVELANAEMTSIFEDQKKNIWIGSTGEGLIRINLQNDIKHYKNNLGVSSDIIYAFYEDKEGSLWLGTEAGLIPFQKKKIFNKSNGLKFNGIYRIIDDGKGFIWLSGNFGLQRIAIQDLINQKNSQVSSQITSRLFNTADGMTNSEANGNISPAGWKMNDGSLWFPTVDGISVVKPSKNESRLSLGSVKILSLQYGGVVHTRLEDIKIPPNVYNVSIDYTNVNLNNPQETTFYYRLRGLSDSWEAAGNRRTAYFTLLNPGQYTFEVKGEQFGTWSEISRISFSVMPVFYQSVWFKSALVFLLLFTGFFVHKLYSSIRQETVLKKLVLERTKELQDSNEKFERTNIELHTSREQFQSLFFQNPYAVLSFDLAGNIVSANKVTSELTGYPIKELLKMSYVPLIPDEFLNEVLERFIKAGIGETQNYQTKIQTANGSSLYVDFTNLPVITNGKISGIYGVVKDITEEKFLADQLLLANERFRLANKATSDSIWDWDLTTNNVKRDENFLEVKLGYASASPENIYAGFIKLIHPEDKERLFENLTRVLSTKSENFWEEECRLLKPDGSYAFVYNRGYIIRDGEDKAIRIIGASQDITARKLEEQQLKLLESVITNTTDAVIISKVEKDGLKIIFVNDAFTRMTEYSLAEVSGKKSPILRGTETDKDELFHFEQAIKLGTPYHSESINYKKNGKAFWVDVNMVPVKNKDGRCTHWVSIERDVTERKKQIIAIEKQNEQLKEIAWTQSHIVRAPLSRMMGIINLFDEGIIQDSEVDEFLKYLKQSGIELDEIIQDIVAKTAQVDSEYNSLKNEN